MKIYLTLLILFVSELINAQKLLRPTYQEAFREFKCNTDPYEKRDDFTQSETSTEQKEKEGLNKSATYTWVSWKPL